MLRTVTGGNFYAHSLLPFFAHFFSQNLCTKWFQLRIERIKFQSSVACWGYFSIGAKGGIHEYADSQFGHIFAHGNNREEARKALMLSLKNIEVVGEIRNPVEFFASIRFHFWQS